MKTERYMTVTLIFDMDGRVEGDRDDLIRALDQLEVDYPGLLQYGKDWTHRLPVVRVTERER